MPKSPRPADQSDAGARATPPAVAPPAIRLIERGGGLNVIRLGQRPSWRDLYHQLLIMGWPLFLFSMAIAYLGANLLFALLYLVGEDAIANARPGSFADAFFFSVQTMATIGYGVMYPQTIYANILMTLETLLGMIAVAIGAGIVFARVSRPTARVAFSSVAVISSYDGLPTLMLRAANQRLNQILRAEVQLTLARNEITAEGQHMRRFHDLELARSRSPLFALTWTIMHPIGPYSPLHGATSEALRDAEIEIIVTLSGVDETFSQTVHARHSYVAEDIRWGKRFADVLSTLPDGRSAVDFRRFDEIAPP